MGLTFDTWALIGLERYRHHMRKVFDVAVSHDVRITAPALVVAEWWRLGEKEKDRAKLLRDLHLRSEGSRCRTFSFARRQARRCFAELSPEKNGALLGYSPQHRPLGGPVRRRRSRSGALSNGR